MKKVLIIYPNYGKVITGGQVYDHYFIESIRLNENLDIDIFEKDPMCKGNLAYMFAYLKLSKEIKQYDVVIANSRYYSRFLLLFCLLKRLNAYNCGFQCFITRHTSWMMPLPPGSFLFTAPAVVPPSGFCRSRSSSGISMFCLLI